MNAMTIPDDLGSLAGFDPRDNEPLPARHGEVRGASVGCADDGPCEPRASLAMNYVCGSRPRRARRGGWRRRRQRR